MNADDVVYALLLVISIPLGHVLRRVDGWRRRQTLGAAVGVAMVMFVCGWDGLHSLIVAVVNALILTAVKPSRCHIVSFVWCFGYIAFFRTTHWIGLPKVVPHANAVQLLLTLKLVGLAFEVHDTEKLQKAASKEDADEKTKLELRYRGVKPSFVEMMCYSYCYVGLLTGPYYKYRTYSDMMQSDATRSSASIRHQMARQMKLIPLVALGYIILSHFFYIEYVHQDEFYENPFWYRLLYMAPMFSVFRLRMYSAWLLSECVCIMAGLGAYPKASKPRCGLGPTQLNALSECETEDSIEYDFETIHNIDIWGCDVAPSIREGMRSWNMSVQFWLAHHVYRRVPYKALRTFVTMAVSAFWHGVHPGYYLSFLTIPPILAAEDAMAKRFRHPTDTQKQCAYDWFNWFWKMRNLEYMGMGFLLLRGDSTMRYWASIGFIMHVLVVVFYLLPLYVNKRKGSEKTESDIPENTESKKQS